MNKLDLKLFGHLFDFIFQPTCQNLANVTEIHRSCNRQILLTAEVTKKHRAQLHQFGMGFMRGGLTNGSCW